MNSRLSFVAIIGFIFAFLDVRANAQNLPGSLSFTVAGSFENAVNENSNSLLISDGGFKRPAQSGVVR
jgi:hypothetical protein